MAKAMLSSTACSTSKHVSYLLRPCGTEVQWRIQNREGRGHALGQLAFAQGFTLKDNANPQLAIWWHVAFKLVAFFPTSGLVLDTRGADNSDFSTVCQ